MSASQAAVRASTKKTGTITVHVTGNKNNNPTPIQGALVIIKQIVGADGKTEETTPYKIGLTKKDGTCVFNAVPLGLYNIYGQSFSAFHNSKNPVTLSSQDPDYDGDLVEPIEFQIKTSFGTVSPVQQTKVGNTLKLELQMLNAPKNVSIDNIVSDLSWDSQKADIVSVSSNDTEMQLTPQSSGLINYGVLVKGNTIKIDDTGGISTPQMSVSDSIIAENAAVQPISGAVKTTTSMTRTETSFTEDTALWTTIRNNTEALSFNNYLKFMDWIFCGGSIRKTPSFETARFNGGLIKGVELLRNRSLPFTDSDAYRVVKAATEAFVMVNCKVWNDSAPFNLLQPFDSTNDNAYFDRRDLPTKNDLANVFNNDYLVESDENKVLPYLAVIRRKLPDIPIKIEPFEKANPLDQRADNCFGILQEKLANPCLLELIWSYWHEEGMLVQSMNAITRRFQNIRASDRDPLANMEIDPLRPLNNLIWSYIQDEQHRLNVSRRNYEYDHHYGLRLEGKAVQNFRPADTRSKFLEAFHHLLRLCTVFYRQDDQTTVKADAFPILNALKEVHLILSQGAHNQFGDLPSTARIEMLMQQWLLARPEFREFLPTRVMVAYPEPWMDRVDAMKKIQGWTNTSVLHFRDLGLFGEQILLSVRWGHWSDEFEPVKAFNWARFFRPQVQGYIHAYRSATGVDLSADPTVNASVDSTLPSILLQKQLDNQQRAS
jgi:hypothetical protein